MGVFAYKEGEANSYFTNAKFAESNTEWVGVDSEGNVKHYYWPFQGSLDFYFYAPHQESGASVTTAEKKLTISTFTNENYSSASYDGEGSGLNYNCADLMYGSTIITDDKTDQAVDVSLKHALALVQVKAKATTTGVVSIKSMTLNDTPISATLNVTYSGDPITGTPTWSEWGNETLDLSIFNAASPESITSTSEFTQLGNEVLVIPGKAQTSFTITYTLGGSDAVFTATLLLSNATTPSWKPGKKYVYKITFGLEEIKFAPEVVEWGTGEVAEESNGGVSVEEVSES